LDDHLHQQRRLAEVRRVLEQLPEAHQRLFALHVWDGLTCEQIASQQQVPLGTVKTRLRAVRRSLRDVISG
jgi:RNA polymerase sigma factor (sigma-70 family)